MSLLLHRENYQLKILAIINLKDLKIKNCLELLYGRQI